MKFKKFNALRRLKLQYCKFADYVVPELLVKETLVNLELVDCSFRDGGYYEADEDRKKPKLPNLEYLNLSSTETFDDEDLIDLLNVSSSNMKHLDLSGSSYELSTYRTLANLKYLTYLNLKGVRNLDDGIMSSIAHNCIKLTHLTIDFRYRGFHNSWVYLTEAGLKDIAYLENLEVLSVQNIKKINDNFIYKITKNCKKIRELILDDCFGITFVGLRELSNLNLLESLSLCNLDKVDDVAITQITKKCTKIKKLVLDECTGITAAGLRELSNLKDLELLSLDDQGNIDDDAIFQIAKNCKKLNNLKITLPINVSSLALYELTKLTNLEVLILENIRIDEVLIHSIAKNCKKLKILYLENRNDRVRLPSFLFLLLIKSCLDLEYLYISKVQISVETLTNAIRARKKRENNTVLTMYYDYLAKIVLNRSGKKSSSLKLSEW